MSKKGLCHNATGHCLKNTCKKIDQNYVATCPQITPHTWHINESCATPIRDQSTSVLQKYLSTWTTEQTVHQSYCHNAILQNTKTPQAFFYQILDLKLEKDQMKI
jgi:hypothetical protein